MVKHSKILTKKGRWEQGHPVYGPKFPGPASLEALARHIGNVYSSEFLKSLNRPDPLTANFQP